MRPTYPCFRPGECPPDWVIELNGWGPVTYKHIPTDFVPELGWVVPGVKCPICDAPKGKRCGVGTGYPAGAHYGRLKAARKAAQRRESEVEDILEARSKAERQARWHRVRRKVMAGARVRRKVLRVRKK